MDGKDFSPFAWAASYSTDNPLCCRVVQFHVISFANWQSYPRAAGVLLRKSLLVSPRWSNLPIFSSSTFKVWGLLLMSLTHLSKCEISCWGPWSICQSVRSAMDVLDPYVKVWDLFLRSLTQLSKCEVCCRGPWSIGSWALCKFKDKDLVSFLYILIWFSQHHLLKMLFFSSVCFCYYCFGCCFWLVGFLFCFGEFSCFLGVVFWFLPLFQVSGSSGYMNSSLGLLFSIGLHVCVYASTTLFLLLELH